jgi:hypothetical protein
MTKQELSKEYLKWIEDEKQISDNLFHQYKKNLKQITLPPARRGDTGGYEKPARRGDTGGYVFRIAAAAVLVLALGFSMWIYRDSIFKPKYTPEQIDLAYQHAVKSLAVCSNSISEEMNKLRKLDEISKSLENINKLENVINN